MSTRLASLVLAISVAACGPQNAGDDDTGGDDDVDGGGGGQPDGGGPGFIDAGSGSPDAAACTATSAMAEQALAPVDIIWVVDSSGSMDEEAAAVQNALNDFSTFIENAGLDHHVILIGDAGAMTVPPPLGNSARFLHVNVTVGSTDAFEKTIQAYPMYQSFLRPNALVHFVYITDDESDWSKAQFDAALAGLGSPGFPGGYTMHAVCSEEVLLIMLPPPLPNIMGPCTGGLGAGGAAAVGDIYMDAVAATGGVWRSICSTDWAPIFTAVAQAVSVPVALPCVFNLPPPPPGMTLDPTQVNFVYTPSGGAAMAIPYRDSAAACAGGPGWYYDDPLAPTQILTCPATCTTLQGDQTGEVHIEFGCATVIDG